MQSKLEKTIRKNAPVLIAAGVLIIAVIALASIVFGGEASHGGKASRSGEASHSGEATRGGKASHRGKVTNNGARGSGSEQARGKRDDHEAGLELTEEESRLAELINEERKNGGLDPVEFDSKLNECALLKAENMVDKNYFSHISPDQGSPFDMMKKHGISFEEAAENIAGAEDPYNAINIWMNNSDQRAGIMNGNMNRGGIAIADSRVYGNVIVLLLIETSNEGRTNTGPSSNPSSQE